MDAEVDPVAPRLTRSPSETVRVQGVRISVLGRDQALSRLTEQVADRSRTRSVYLVNAHTVNLARRDPEYAAVLNRGDLVLNDGIGMALAARMKGTVLRHNFCGTDFVPEFLAHCVERRNGGIRVFFLGGVPGRPEEAARALAAQVPGVAMAGSEHGYGADHREVVERIRESEADVLLVAMGNPLQESWIDRHKADLRVPLCFGVGALFDFLAGAVPRAPQALRRAGLEWAYRLALEPGRLASRYVLGNPAFLAHAMADALRS